MDFERNVCYVRVRGALLASSEKFREGIDDLALRFYSSSFAFKIIYE